MKFNHAIPDHEFEKIERFLTHQMDEQEATAFSLAAKSDPTLQEKIEELQLLLLGIQESSLEQQLRNVNLNASEPARVRTIQWKKWLAAASILLIVGVSAFFLLQSKNTHQQLYSSYYSPDPGLATVMSSSSDYAFEKAMVEYKSGEYAKAKKAWTDLLQQKPGNDTLIYFIAAASQASGDDELAITNLQQVASNTNSGFYLDACWYLGLSYLKKGDTNNAIHYIQLSGYPQASEIIKAITTKH